MALCPCSSFRDANCKALVCALLLLLAPAAAYLFAQPTAEQPPTLQIRGTVVNTANDQPVAHVLVSTSDNQAAAFTDENGHFELAVTRGSAFSVRKPGFKATRSSSGPIGVAGGVGAPSWIEVAMVSSDVVISMTPEATLSGHVSLSGADLADGMEVRLYRQVVQDGRAHWDPMQTVTNSEGEYRFAELDPGLYRLGAGVMLDRGLEDLVRGKPKSGYAATYYPGVPEFGSAATLRIAAGEHATADFNLSRQMFYPVTAQIVPAQHNVGLNFVLLDEDGHSINYPLGMSLDGQTLQASLPDGKYKIGVYTYGEHPMFGQASVTVAGAPVSGLRISMSPGVNIPVVVRREFTAQTTAQDSRNIGPPPAVVIDSTGTPRPMPITLDLQPAEQGSGIPAGLAPPRAGDDPDSWSIRGVAPGRYWVRVFPQGMGYVAAITAGNVNLADEPLVVGSSSQPAPIEVILRDGVATVKGKVRSVNNTNQHGACIYLVPREGSPAQLQEAVTDQVGSFSFPQVPPGEFLLLAFDTAQELAYRDPDAMHLYESAGQVVTLTAGGSADVEVDLVSSSR